MKPEFVERWLLGLEGPAECELKETGMRLFTKYGAIAATAALFIGGFVSVAGAVDLYEETAYAPKGFNGPWLGVNVQYGQTHTEVDASTGGTSFANFGGLSGMGGKIGAEAGLDVQFGKAVLGVSGGFDWNRIDSDLSFGPFNAKLENGNSYYGQGRVGLTPDSMTLYYALLRYSFQEGAEATWTGGGSYQLADRKGWGVGAGIESYVAPQVAIKLEYVHNFFGEEEVYSSGPFSVDEITDEDVVKLGVGYRF